MKIKPLTDEDFLILDESYPCISESVTMHTIEEIKEAIERHQKQYEEWLKNPVIKIPKKQYEDLLKLLEEE